MGSSHTAHRARRASRAAVEHLAVVDHDDRGAGLVGLVGRREKLVELFGEAVVGRGDGAGKIVSDRSIL